MRDKCGSRPWKQAPSGCRKIPIELRRRGSTGLRSSEDQELEVQEKPKCRVSGSLRILCKARAEYRICLNQMNTSGIAANESAAHPLLKTLRIYGTAVLAVVVALGLALFLQHLQFRDIAVPLLLFAIAIASWYGGRGPSALAAILSISSFYWYFVEPV